jgi:HSP20 family protein
MSITRFRTIAPEFLVPSRRFEFPPKLGRLFDEMLEPTETLGWTPVVDVVETDTILELYAELPGMSRDDIHIEIMDGLITLKGEKKNEKEEKTGDYRLWERSYGAFERSFSLPRSIDTKAVKAEFENGVLKITLPKTTPSMGKKVEITGK